MATGSLCGAEACTVASKATQRGVTSIEYALIASLIAIAIIGGVASTGDANSTVWTSWTGKVIGAIKTALGS